MSNIMQKTKKLFSSFVVFLMAFSLTATSFAQTNVEKSTDHNLLSFEEEIPYVLNDSGLLLNLQRNADRYFLSNARVSELPLESVFELFRVQVALDMGMDLDTFLYGDIGEWSDNYLRQWRHENGVEEPSYTGEMYVRFNTETGGAEVHSLATHAHLYTFFRSPEESLVMQKIWLLRAPDTRRISAAGSNFDEDTLIQLMDTTLNIGSVEELMDSLPLACLEEKMYRADLSFADISRNYWMNSASADIIVIENQMDDDVPIIVPPPTYAETPYVIELMEREGISAREALVILRGEEEIDAAIQMENTALNQVERQLFTDITPFSNQPSHQTVPNPTANPFKMVVQLETGSHLPPYFDALGTGFLVKNGMVVTAGHVLYCQYKGLVNFVDATPGRNGNLPPSFGTHRINNSNFFVSWQWYANSDISHDWGYFNTGNAFNNVGARWWLDTRTNNQLLAFGKNIIGFPIINNMNRRMYTNSGSVINPTTHPITSNVFWSTNYSMNGYSGSPVADQWGWVVGINRGGENLLNGDIIAQNVRLTTGLVNLWS